MKSFSFSLIAMIFLTCIQKTSTYTFPNTHIDWCLYFQRLQIYKPECKFYDDVDLHVEREIRAKPISQPRQYSLIQMQMQQCSAHYMYCTANYQCGDGQLRCIDMIRYRECCAPTRRECPPVTHLNFRCIVSEPVSWCDEDSDCHTTPQQRCCPTGCNYNICI
ncbi:hypothetical protein GCK72_019364 [Caenorhabditis remanei]|uniref:WAP domain-containing protein n=2 Tax=Caenorhabditis remanei TaxID=31234 RepID=E3LK84_CAERE|nr:hypothetical protein GCK72_019364 [Caenorhabditis remanei]EFO99777.1 hypothetical protein CRE_18614 [Caenorhabditis remanei]KAF1752809.1 hypothetical protein GCK72_019364 [Caenorhabditis remanei]